MKQIFSKDEDEKKEAVILDDYQQKEEEAEAKEIELPFSDFPDEEAQNFDEMISAEEFFENRIRNEDVAKKHLLQVAQNMTMASIQNAYNNELNWNIYPSKNKKSVTISITLCQYGYFYGEDLTNIGYSDIWNSIINDGLFPIEEYKKWLSDFGWRLDCHEEDCTVDDEIWLELVSRQFII